jgi:hypothetical protein
VRIELCFTTWEKTSLKSVPGIWLQPLATNLALYLASSLGETLSFILKTHLQRIGFFSLGNLTNPNAKKCLDAD